MRISQGQEVWCKFAAKGVGTRFAAINPNLYLQENTVSHMLEHEESHEI
jgi:hypothetical protein